MGQQIRVAAAILSTSIVALIAYYLMDTSAGSWYSGLVKPQFALPDWFFWLAWMLTYVFMAGALCIVWMQPADPSKEHWVRFYFVQLIFNITFLMFFFWLHAIFIAFINVLFLGLLVVSLIAGAYDHDRRALYLLLPYFLSVIFTGYLVLNIWLLN